MEYVERIFEILSVSKFVLPPKLFPVLTERPLTTELQIRYLELQIQYTELQIQYTELHIYNDTGRILGFNKTPDLSTVINVLINVNTHFYREHSIDNRQ